MNEEEMLHRINVLEEKVSELEDLASSDDLEGAQDTDIRELFNDFDPSTHFERVLIIGYYIENFDDEDKVGFTTEDLREGYIKCKTPLPANLSDVIAKVGGKGWAMKVNERDGFQVWQLTTNGEEVVEKRTEV